MKKLKIVSMVRINGQWMKQEDAEPKLFRKLLEEKFDSVMKSLGFERDKEEESDECKN